MADMKKQLRFVAQVSIMAMTLVGVSQPAFAEDQASGAKQGADNGEIIVTAQRRAEPLNRVGVSVAAVSAEQIKLFNVEQPQDLRRFVPGFQALESASTGAPIYVLRGVGFDAPAPATSSPVGIYQDEVSVPYPYMSLGLGFDLERIEVLKGPQGTLYGRNSTGGLVNFIAAKPTDKVQGSITVGAGSFQYREAEGFLSGPLGGGLKARIAFQTQNRERGWQYSVTRPDDRLGVWHRDAFRGILDYEPEGSAVHITATGNYWRINGDTPAPQAVEFLRDPASLTQQMSASLIPDTRDNQAADWTSASYEPARAAAQRRAGIGDPNRPKLGQNTRFYSGTIKASIELSPSITLASLTNYSDLKYDSTRDFGGLQTESLTQRSNGRIKTFSQELRLLGEMSNLSWSVGGYYAHDDTSQHDLGFVGDLTTITGGLPFLPVLNTVFGSPFTADQLEGAFRNYAAQGDSKVKVAAIFGNAEFKLSDQFKVRAGARYTKDKETGSSCALNVNDGQTPFIALLYPLLTGNAAIGQPTPNGCYTLKTDFSGFTKVFNNQSDSNVSWRVGFDYTPNDNTLVYAVISRGFKAGSFPVYAASNAAQLTPVRKEQLTSFELGTKLRMFDRALQLNTSVFYYDYKDRQTFGRIPDVVFGSLLRIVNIPKSEVYGGEVDATLRLNKYFTARGSLAYIKTKVKEFVGFDTRSAAGIPMNFAGASLPYSPKLQASGSLVGDVPVNSDVAVLGSMNVSYQSRSSSVIGHEQGFDIAPFALVGAKLALHSTSNKWSVEVYADNLFDKYYYTSAQRGNESLLRYAGMPRTVGVRATYNF